MKTLYLLKSLLSANKKYIVLITVCFILTALLFNLSVAVTEDYIEKKIYIARTDYEDNYAALHISSENPITDEYIVDLLKSAELDEFFLYGMNGHYIPRDNTSFSSEEDLIENNDIASRRFYSLVYKELLTGYSYEYSEAFETGLSGEKPDKDKDYGGKVPVIASFGSEYSIGDIITSDFYGKKLTFIVTAKYTDDNLATYLGGSEYAFYTDREILYKNGVAERPENIRADSSRQYNMNIFVKKPDGINEKEFGARLGYLSDVTDNNVSRDIYAVLSDDTVDFNHKAVLRMLPTIFIVFLTGIAGTTANLLISADKRRSTYRIYRICNATKSTLIKLTVLCETVITVFSLAVSFLISIALDLFFAQQVKSVTKALVSPFSVLVTCGVFIGITMIMIISRVISTNIGKEKIL